MVATNMPTSTAALFAVALTLVKLENEPKLAPAADPEIDAFENIILLPASSLVSKRFFEPDTKVKRTKFVSSRFVNLIYLTLDVT